MFIAGVVDFERVDFCGVINCIAAFVLVVVGGQPRAPLGGSLAKGVFSIIVNVMGRGICFLA